MRKHENSNPRGKAPSTKPSKEFLPVYQFIGACKREVLRKHGHGGLPSEYGEWGSEAFVKHIEMVTYARKVAERYYRIYGDTGRYSHGK